MFQATPSNAAAGKPGLYGNLQSQLRGLLHGERDLLANAANMAALLYHGLPDVNWAGFYRLMGNDLVLGPFQGKPACVRLPMGKGVCAAAAERRKTVIVPDVCAFPGHIACDAASRSEIVVPAIRKGTLLGVLDIDSPLADRFDSTDQAGLELMVAMLVDACE
jgi:GAF domain-containing protein